MATVMLDKPGLGSVASRALWLALLALATRGGTQDTENSNVNISAVQQTMSSGLWIIHVFRHRIVEKKIAA